jgi:glycosyltransferase involved in cell wall biosynthesis
MNKPKVSVLVPICNVERYLRECLDSLVNQTLEDIEIICINDGSTDSSLSIIREYERRDQRIVVIDKPNSGYGDSMNKGIDISRGEYIGIVESDDFAVIDMFEKLYKAAKKDSLDIVRSNYRAHVTGRDPAKDGLVENLAACESYGKVFDPMDNPRVFMCQPAIWTSIYKKSLLDEHDVRFLPTPGASFQDTAFYFKAFYAASRVMLLKEGYLHYRIDNANSSVKNQNKLYCVCDEYAEVWRYAKTDPKKLEVMKRWIPRQQFEAYLWNLNRLSPELQQMFYSRYVEEFEKIRNAGLIDSARFDERSLARLNAMVDTPEDYFLGQYGPLEPKRTVIACVNGLSVPEAKRALASLLEKLSENDEVFVVSPSSEAIVFELKNENEGMGRLRSDADLIGQRLVAQFDLSACRGAKVSVLGLGSIEADFAALADAADEGGFWCGAATFALGCDVTPANAPKSLVSLVLRGLVGRELGALLELPASWASMLCSDIRGADENFGDSIVGAKEIANELMSADASYEVKRLLFGQLLGVWSSVRKAYSTMEWDKSCELRAEYLSMADAPALLLPCENEGPAPALSVISPVYNAGEYLEECLSSIFEQTFSDFEVILVNDGSPDGSLEILESTAKHDGRVRVVSQFNCGAGAARNRGIGLARGKRVIFIDPDDRFATDHVFADLVEAMDRNGAAMCGGSLSLLKPSGKIKSNFSFDESFYHVAGECDVAPSEVWSDYGWIRFMYDASLFADGTVRFPQLNWYEDPVFFLSAVLKAGGYHVAPIDVYHYRVGYKEIEWSVPKVRDMLRGMGINLRSADDKGMDELYVTIVRRFNRDYREAIADNLEDPGVYEQLVAIQTSLNHEKIRRHSSYDAPYYFLAPLYCNEERRAFAVERLATKLAESKAYTGMQRLIDRLMGRDRRG